MRWERKTLLRALSGIFFIFCMQTTFVASPTPQNEKTLLRRGLNRDYLTLDPITISDHSGVGLIRNTFATLFLTNSQGDLIPYLVDKFQVDERCQNYSFHLKSNVKFSDGNPITSQDVDDSFLRVVNRKKKSPFGFLLSNVKTNPDLKHLIEIQDKQNFKIHLINPDCQFLSKLDASQLSIVKSGDDLFSTFHSQNNQENTRFVSSGPYVFEHRDQVGRYWFKKNKYFWDSSRILADREVFQVYENFQKQISAYFQRKIEMTDDITWSRQNLQEFGENLRWRNSHVLYELGFNFRNRDVRNNLHLRKALSAALPRIKLSQKLLSENEQPLYSLTGSPEEAEYSWSDSPAWKRIQLARKELRQAGYHKKHPLHLVIAFVNDPWQRRVMNYMKGLYLDSLGRDVLTVTLKPLPRNEFSLEKNDQDVTLFQRFVIGKGSSPLDILYSFQSNSMKNDLYYKNRNIDLAVNKLKTFSGNTLLTRKKALQLLQDDYPSIPLFSMTTNILCSNAVVACENERQFWEEM